MHSHTFVYINFGLVSQIPLLNYTSALPMGFPAWLSPGQTDTSIAFPDIIKFKMSRRVHLHQQTCHGVSMTSLPRRHHPWRHWQCDVIYCDVIGYVISNNNPDLATKITFFWLPWQLTGFQGNGSCEVVSVPIPDFPAKFGTDRSINDRGDSTQTNTQTFLVL